MLFVHIFLYFLSDINECREDQSVCHPQSICTNIIGSYSCQCRDGFEGNGVTCEGQFELLPRLNDSKHYGYKMNFVMFIYVLFVNDL